MEPISLTADIDASPERVFELIADLAVRPAFTDHFISDFRLTRIDAVGVGAAARMRVDAPGGIEYMETVLIGAECPKRVVESGGGGRWDRVPIKTLWGLEPGSSTGGTRLTLTFSTDPTKPIDRIRDRRSERWWRRRWASALERLSELAVAGNTAPDRVTVAGGDRLPGVAG